MARRTCIKRNILTDKNTDYLFDYFMNDEMFNEKMKEQWDKELEKKLENFQQSKSDETEKIKTTNSEKKGKKCRTEYDNDFIYEWSINEDKFNEELKVQWNKEIEKKLENHQQKIVETSDKNKIESDNDLNDDDDDDETPDNFLLDDGSNNDPDDLSTKDNSSAADKTPKPAVSKHVIEILQQGNDAGTNLLAVTSDKMTLESICLDIFEKIGKPDDYQIPLANIQKLLENAISNGTSFDNDFYLKIFDSVVSFESAQISLLDTTKTFLDFIFGLGLKITERKLHYFCDKTIREYMVPKIDRSVLWNYLSYDFDCWDLTNNDNIFNIIKENISVLNTKTDIFQLYIDDNIANKPELIEKIEETTNFILDSLDGSHKEFIVAFIKSLNYSSFCAKLDVSIIKKWAQYIKDDETIIEIIINNYEFLKDDQYRGYINLLADHGDIFSPTKVFDVLFKFTKHRHYVFHPICIELMNRLEEKINKYEMFVRILQESHSLFIKDLVKSSFMTNFDVNQNDNEIFEIINSRISNLKAEYETTNTYATYLLIQDYGKIKDRLKECATGPTKSSSKILINACTYGKLYTVKKLFSKMKSDEKFKEQLIRLAILNGNEDIVSYFIATKDGVFIKWEFMQLAIREGQTRIVEIFYPQFGYNYLNLADTVPAKNQLAIYKTIKNLISQRNGYFKPYVTQLIENAVNENQLDFVLDILRMDIYYIEPIKFVKIFADKGYVDGVYAILQEKKDLDLKGIISKSKEVQLIIDLYTKKYSN